MKCCSKLKRGGAKLEEGLGFIRCLGSLGTKRVLIWDVVKDLSIDSSLRKKRFITELDDETSSDGECYAIQKFSQDLLRFFAATSCSESMALKMKCCSKMKRGGAELEEGLGFSQCSGSFWTKTVFIWDVVKDLSIDSSLTKKRFITELDDETGSDGECSAIRTFPQDLLVRILCFIDHDYFNHLFHVSKSIREASLIAKRVHFSFTTPLKVRAFHMRTGHSSTGHSDEIEKPNAPKQARGCVS